MGRKQTIAELSLSLTGVFEAELLLELMLREWNHPRAVDQGFREDLLESAAEVLRAAVAGEQVITGIQPQHINLVAAICSAEATALTLNSDIPGDERQSRQKWIESVRRSVPSCFCDPELLD